MPLTPYLQKAMLDWCFGGAAATQPAQRWITFATASPTTNSPFDGPFQTRLSVRMAAASSPQGSVSNNINIGTVTATAVATALGFNIWDSTAGGTRLCFGTLTAALGCRSSTDQVLIAAGNLKITIA